jgi:hypothetical protein
MKQFDLTHKVGDLLHDENRWFNKQTFGEETLIDLLPDQLTFTKSSMSTVLREMYNNLNYYYQVTGPLHTSKNYTEQYNLVINIMSNLTQLQSDMDGSKLELDRIERDLHDSADSHFRDNDRNLNMDKRQAQDLFDDAISDFQTSLNLVKRKFAVIDKKVEELGEITDDFHLSTDKLEALFVRDIEKRRKYFQEHPIAQGSVLIDGM